LTFWVSKLRIRSEIFRRDPTVSGFAQNQPSRRWVPM
jgi:hypothetical protein